MTFKKIYRGMENGAETIQENFTDAVSKSDNETVSGVKNFKDGLQVSGSNVITEKISIVTGVDFGFGVKGSLYRVGNTVTVSIIDTQEGGRANGLRTIATTIPLGYRPVCRQIVNASLMSGATPQYNKSLVFDFYITGQISMFSNTTSEVGLTVSVVHSWTTTNDFPVK